MASTVLLVASRRGGPETDAAVPFPFGPDPATRSHLVAGESRCAEVRDSRANGAPNGRRHLLCREERARRLDLVDQIDYHGVVWGRPTG